MIQELRPQDSIPFLRRVSTDFQKADVVRYLSQLDLSDSSPVSASPRHKDEFGIILPTERRTSHSSIPPLDNDISPREHSFVKTTFGKRKFDFVIVVFFLSHSVVISRDLSSMPFERQEKCCSLFTVQSHFPHEMCHKRSSDLQFTSSASALCSVCGEG